MSDDLYDAFGGGDDLYPDDEEETTDDAATAGEGTNRTFIIAAGALGILLVCALGTFFIWMFVVAPKMATNTPEVLPATEAAPIDTATPRPTWTNTPTPTATVRPTNTPTPTPVIHNTPMTESGTVEGGETGETGGEANDPIGATETPQTLRRTPTPGALAEAQATPTVRTTRTATSSSGNQTPKSGLGEVVLVVGAALLLGVLFTARKLRKA